MDNFEYPREAVWDESTYTRFYGRFTVEPLEKGFATTVGNSLRRVLLSSIGGVAITAVKIDGAAHEFTAIPGVKEDVTDIILNLKRVYLQANVSELPQDPFRVEITGREEVLAGDLFPGSELTVLNAGLHVASLSPETKLALELTVRRGFGYVPVNRMETEGNPIGTIPVAASFSPVTKVAFQSESTRVGQRVDYERLIFEVWTNGAVTPREAVVSATDILTRHFALVAGAGEDGAGVAAGGEAGRADATAAIDEIGLSTRVANILKAGGVAELGALCALSAAELKRIKNVGDKAFEEIVTLLKENNWSLKEE